MIHSDGHRENYDLKFGYQWEGGEVDFSAARFSGWYNLPQVYSATQLDPRVQIPKHLVGDDYSSMPKEYRNAFMGKLTLNNISPYLIRLSTTLYYLKQEMEEDNIYLYTTNAIPNGNYFVAEGVDEGHTFGGSIQADFALGDHLLTLGVDADRANAKHNVASTDSWNNIGLDIREGYSQTIAVFAQDEWRLSKTFSATLGLRYTENENVLTKENNKPYLIGSIKYQNVTGSLGFVYHDNDGLTVRAIASQGFRAPTLTGQFIGGTGRYLPNPDLEAETSTNFELGTRYQARNWALDLAFFYSRLKDAFYGQDSDDDHPRGGKYMKIMNSKGDTSYGAELALEYTFEDLGLTPYLSLTAMRYVREYRNYYKTDNTGVPRTWGVGGLRWQRDLSDNLRVYTNASLSWSSAFHEEDQEGVTNETLYNDKGLRADFVVGLEGGEEHKYKAALNFRNIGDRRYEPYGYFEPGFHVVATLGYEY